MGRSMGVDRMLCGVELATMASVHRAKIVERLLVQRLLRKSRHILSLWESSARDWNQTLHLMTAHAMGAPRNGAAFERLAEMVSYVTCLRERGHIVRVEAMLLGSSGLLGRECFDSQLLGMQNEYDYLARKYELRSMKAGEWDLRGNYPAANPVMRIVQFAAIITKEEFSFDRLVGVRSLAEVASLLEIEMGGSYWAEKYGTKASGGRLGRAKVQMMTINLVIPMMFAYGEVTHNEELKERAMALLEEIPSEQNSLVARWTGAGVPSTSAYDSQALIELAHLCDEGRCAECPLAKQLKKA